MPADLAPGRATGNSRCATHPEPGKADLRCTGRDVRRSRRTSPRPLREVRRRLSKDLDVQLRAGQKLSNFLLYVKSRQGHERAARSRPFKSFHFLLPDNQKVQHQLTVFRYIQGSRIIALPNQQRPYRSGPCLDANTQRKRHGKLTNDALLASTLLLNLRLVLGLTRTFNRKHLSIAVLNI